MCKFCECQELLDSKHANSSLVLVNDKLLCSKFDSFDKPAQFQINHCPICGVELQKGFDKDVTVVVV